MRRYAEDTSVPISNSRGEIDGLLRNWGAQGIQWTDDWERSRVMVRFTWPHQGSLYMARFVVQLPTRKQLEPEALDRRSAAKGVSEVKLEKLYQAKGRHRHRVLALWLKAALNAVDSGIVDAATIFLPFLEDKHGKTVAEIAGPKLELLLAGSAERLLGDGKAGAR